MMRVTFLIICCLQSSLILVDTARILGIFPIPSISHQVVFRALMLELAKRGHELVIITPNPALPKERPPDNITEIDTGQSYQFMTKMMKQASTSNKLKRGVVMDVDIVTRSFQGMAMLVAHHFDLPQVRKLLEDRTQKFDLVFVEAIANYPLIVSRIFNAPAILFSSFYGFPEHFDTMGAISWHPIFYPMFYRNKFNNLTFWEKIQEVYLEFKIFKLVRQVEEDENVMLKKNYGPDAPIVADLKKNVQMLFLNSHPIFGNNRPVPPSVIYLGALHLQPVKPLPEDLKKYVDNLTRGVVYVSFGTNVRPSQMDEDLLNTFLQAFAALPYDIIWKFDGDNLKKIPNNVHIQKWFPQRDLLMHRNVKVFVTQGGLQSTDEAIDAGVPLVGIPMIADQWFNVNKYVELGIGVQIDVLTMTAEDLTSAVIKVIKDNSFRENIRRVRAVMKDQPQSPLERAVWWTEHFLRHGGAHLRAPSANTTWHEYFMTDVLLAIICVVTAICAILIFLCCKIMSSFKRYIVKTKQN